VISALKTELLKRAILISLNSTFLLITSFLSVSTDLWTGSIPPILK
jgi:hypothetical protein